MLFIFCRQLIYSFKSKIFLPSALLLTVKVSCLELNNPKINLDINENGTQYKIISELETNLPEYDYEIIFIDNDSKDNTRIILRQLTDYNKKIKAVSFLSHR